MCGISGIFGPGADLARLEAMIASQRHRGPDATGRFASRSGAALLGHNRLSILDLSTAGLQPMSSSRRELSLVLNGEIYNYLELRNELAGYPFRSRTDTEVALAAYEQWGDSCVDRFVGMFAVLFWDDVRRRLFAARDRFGVKPLYYHHAGDGTLMVSSEIKALHAAGVERTPDDVAWATYLSHGLVDYSERTFWSGIRALPPGHTLTWEDGEIRIARWYDVGERAGERFDDRPLDLVEEHYRGALEESVALRFRSDVPVGINLSGGLDSSLLLGLVNAVQGADSDVKAFTFVTGDDRYDELPWVRAMLARTRHPLVVCRIEPDEVPSLAESVHEHEDEPFGGLPTLAYARLFERARSVGIKVLLDGQGMDEQLAGYDYYRERGSASASIVQGTRESPVRPEALVPEFRARAEEPPRVSCFSDVLRNLQYRDARFTKIPRALRFNDRISMRASTELREPFLDHRLFELALRQRRDRKIAGTAGKWLARRVASRLLPAGVVEAPKRPLQTPQREWLRGPLRAWVDDLIESALQAWGGSWLDASAVRREWSRFASGRGDNSFYVWQWISAGLTATSRDRPSGDRALRNAHRISSGTAVVAAPVHLPTLINRTRRSSAIAASDEER